MLDLRALKDRAADLANRGKLERAVEAYRSVLREDPRDAATRQRLAEVMRRAGRTLEAVEEYARTAHQYGRDGLFAKAIALSRTILELDPAHRATQGALAVLYAARERAGHPPPLRGAATLAALGSKAAAPSRLPTTATPLAQILSAAQAATADGVLDDAEFDLDEEPPGKAPARRPAATPREEGGRLPAAASAVHGARADRYEVPDDAVLEARPELPKWAEAKGAPAGEPIPPGATLPRVPIFSDLSREAFIALAGEMVLRRLRAGEAVLREGEEGTSLYVVAGGELLVTKRDDRGEPVRLARLSEGDFFGEMAILAGTPRLATVTAEKAAEVLEIRAEVLLDLARRFPHLATSLRRFQRQRLLANALAVSPVFRPLSREDRLDVMTRFRAREVVAGEVMVVEGEPSDGLYVVLDGAMRVRRRKGATTVEVAELREGDVFGEMSCLHKTPATATVAARRGGTLLRLPRERFDELVLSHPRILEAVSRLSEERRENLDAILSGHAQWTEDGLVLI